jgi:hypothetical protein
MTAIVLIPLIPPMPGAGAAAGGKEGALGLDAGDGEGVSPGATATAVDVAFRGPRYQTVPSTTAAARTAYASFDLMKRIRSDRHYMAGRGRVPKWNAMSTTSVTPEGEDDDSVTHMETWFCD